MKKKTSIGWIYKKEFNRLLVKGFDSLGYYIDLDNDGKYQIRKSKRDLMTQITDPEVESEPIKIKVTVEKI